MSMKLRHIFSNGLMIFSMAAALMLSACGGGGGGGTSTPAPTATAGGIKAVLGPLAGATIKAYRLTDLVNPIEGPIRSNGSLTDLNAAGSFDLTLAGIPKSEWILVTATGGADIDANDDCVVDAVPTLNTGTIHAIAKASDWLNGSCSVNVITDMIYRGVSASLDLPSASSSAIQAALDAATSNWITDINNDGLTDYRDSFSFNPVNHKSRTKVNWTLISSGYIASIHSGDAESVMQKHFSLILASKAAGYNIATQSSSLVKSTPKTVAKVKVTDVTGNGVPDRAYIEKVENGALISTDIQNKLGLSDHQIKINAKGHELILTFKGQQNVLTGLDQASLQNLLTMDSASIQLSANNPGIYEIAIPKTVIPLLSTATWSATLDGKPVPVGRLGMIRDDPLIGWYFSDAPAPINYTITGNNAGGSIIIIPAVKNQSNNLTFDIAERGSLSPFTSLGCFDNLDGGTFLPGYHSGVGKGTYCVDIAGSLVQQGIVTVAAQNSPNQTVLFKVDANGLVYLNGVQAPASAQPVALSVSDPNYKVQLTVAASNPGNASAGLSFVPYVGRAYHIGDTLASMQRLWVSIVAPTPAPGSGAGVNWTAQTSGTVYNLKQVVWNGTQFVAVGDAGAILTSPDGAAWTVSNVGTTNWFRDITWSGTQFVAVGEAGKILTSPDGVTWTAQTSGTANRLNSVIWSSTQFVVVGDGGTVLSSLDGVNWTPQTSGTVAPLHDIAWNGTQFVAVGGFRNNAIILTSPDGVNWTPQTSGTTIPLSGITWSGTQFVVVGGGGTILSSLDGVNWMVQVSGLTATTSLNNIIWSGTQFVATGWDYTGLIPGVFSGAGIILTSPDGMNWTRQTSGTANWLYGLTWSGTKFIVVGDVGTILVSP